MNRQRARAGNVARVAASRDRWDRVVVVCASAVVASPAIFNPVGYDQYQLPKLILQTLAVVIGLAALLISAGPPVGRVFVPLVALLSILFVSAVVSVAPKVALLGTSSRRFGFVGWLTLGGAFILGSSCRNGQRRLLLIKVLLSSSALISVYAVLQRLGWDPFTTSGPAGALRPTSTLGGATYLGGFLALSVVCALSAALAGLISWKWIAGVLSIDAFALLLTQSRGGWVGGIVGSVCAALWFTWSHSSKRRAVLWVSGIVACVVVVVLVVPGLAARAATLTHPTDGTAGARFTLMWMGVDAVVERPILGWGPDLSRPALHDQIGSTFEKKYGDVRIEDRAHNLFIDVALWGGLAGLGAVVWLLVTVGRVAFAARGDGTVTTISFGIIAFGCHLMFNFPVPDLDVVVWLLAGSLVPLRSKLATFTTRPLPLYMVAPLAVVVVAVVCSRSADALASDRNLRVGVDRENASNPAGARDAYTAAQLTSPDSALYDEVLARFYLRANDPINAEAATRRGVFADPSDPYMIELRARSLTAIALANGDAASAVTAQTLLEGLIHDSPNDGSLHLELGTALAAQGSYAQAENEYRRASVLDPGRCEPYRNLALMEERNGEQTAAHLDFKKALSCNPTDAAAAAGIRRTSAAG